MTDFWQTERLAAPVRPQKREVADSSSKRSAARSASILPQSDLLQPLSFVIPGSIPGKPRMTRRDKWAKRPAVMKYRDWADLARKCAQEATKLPLPTNGLIMIVYLPMPDSWSKKKRERMKGQPHRVKPDIDNLEKSCLDSLLPDGDAMIHEIMVKKFWADDAGARTEVTLW